MRARAQAVLITVASFAPAADAQVFTVDAAGGGDFTTIQEAVDTVPTFATIVVRGGVYNGFFIQGKPLVITADRGALVETGPILVWNVGATREVVLIGLDVEGHDALSIGQCAGAVRVADCRFIAAPQSDGAVIQSSTDVAFTACWIEGGRGYSGGIGFDGLFAMQSTVAFHDTTVVGGRGGNVPVDWAGAGGIGVHLASSFVSASGSWFVGGNGGNSSSLYGCGGYGGTGLVLESSEAFLFDSPSDGGWGGYGGFACDGDEGIGIKSDSESKVNELEGPARELALPLPHAGFGPAHMTVTGDPGDLCILVHSPEAEAVFYSALNGPLLVERITSMRTFIGSIGPDGTLATSMELPQPRPGELATRHFIQVVVQSATGSVVLGNAAPFVAVDCGILGPDCNGNGLADACDLDAGQSVDCNGNGIPDECEPDCDGNGIQDDCDIASGVAADCDGNGIPDTCEPDCNANGITDACDLAAGTSEDVNENDIPDECEGELRLYVDADAIGANDGSDWANAFNELRDATAMAVDLDLPFMEIWVAEGTYAPAPLGGDRGASFPVRRNTYVYGGFAGTETTVEERDWNVNKTILSGDLSGDDVGFMNNEENSYRVLEHIEGPAVIDGFEVTGANGETVSIGGGLYVHSGYWTNVRNCRFYGNVSLRGGGLYHSSGNTVYADCRFENNVALSSGGGIHHRSFSDVTFVDCIVSGNSAVEDGGGIYCYQNGGLSFVGGRISSNTAVTGGGAFSFNDLRLEACLVNHNSADFGGGVWSDELTAERVTFLENTATDAGGATWTRSPGADFTSCAFVGNYAGGAGGGALWHESWGFNLVSCSLYANSTAGVGGGVYATGSETTTLGVRGSVLWGNADSSGLTELAQIEATALATTIDHSCVEGWSGLYEGIGTIAADPRFIDATGQDGTPGTFDDDLRLAAGSPCIDAGDNASLPPGSMLDVAGLPRFVDDPNVPDSGPGRPPVVDMGAHERQP